MSDPALVALVERLRQRLEQLELTDELVTGTMLANIHDAQIARQIVYLKDSAQWAVHVGRELCDALARPVAAPPHAQDALGLVESEAQRWRAADPKTAAHWEDVAAALKQATVVTKSLREAELAVERGPIPEMRFAVAAPPEGTLTREQAETRLDENELARVCRVAMEHGIPAAHRAVLAALFPHDGSRT